MHSLSLAYTCTGIIAESKGLVLRDAWSSFSLWNNINFEKLCVTLEEYFL